MSWLIHSRPNGANPLPVPVPLQTVQSNFVRDIIDTVSGLHVIITHMEFSPHERPEYEAAIGRFCADAEPCEDVVLILPGMIGSAAWVLTAYRTASSLDRSYGDVPRVADLCRKISTCTWHEYVLILRSGFLWRR